MFYKIIFSLFNKFPPLKQFFWKFWYTKLANSIKNPDLKFMNYGYHSDDDHLILDSEFEKERYPIQLYHHVISDTKLSGLKVLEVGSGRGGGCNFINKYFQPKSITGLDLSPTAIDLCNRLYKTDNLKFVQGSSEKMPFEDNFFDVVINIESSHCYANMELFISEVSRVLKRNGNFLFCDLRTSDKIEELLSQLNSSNLKLISHEDITSNILSASEKMTTKRIKLINSLNVNYFLSNILKSFAGVKGGKVYDGFKYGNLSYISASVINLSKS